MTFYFVKQINLHYDQWKSYAPENLLGTKNALQKRPYFIPVFCFNLWHVLKFCVYLKIPLCFFLLKDLT